MKAVIKDVLPIFVVSFTAILLFHYYFDLSDFSKEANISFNVHDTYFVVEKFLILSLIIIFFLKFYFIVRVFLAKFKRLKFNYFFLVINFIFLLLFPSFIEVIKSFLVEPGWTIYPPLSALPQKIESEPNVFNLIYNLSYGYYFITIFLEIFVAFQTGLNYKKHSV